MAGTAEELAPISPAYVAGIMDALGVQPKQVALITGLAPATVARLRTGSRHVNQKQICQILVATGRASEQTRVIEQSRQPRTRRATDAKKGPATDTKREPAR